MSEKSFHVLILSASLNQESRSAVLCEFAHQRLQERGDSVELLDLRKLDALPFAGSPEAHAGTESIQVLKAAFRRATHILMGVPNYNFGPSAAAKNLIELMGSEELDGKIVGFLVAAGGQRGYMGILSLANSLMLDFRCWIAPRFVHATGADVKDGQIVTEDIRHRIDQLISEMRHPGAVPPSPN